MNILFVHQNFPAQFKFLAPQLSKLGYNVYALKSGADEEEKLLHGVRYIYYKNQRSSTENIHPWVSDFETKVIRAESCYRRAIKLKESGFQPDLIISHHGWGESTFLDMVWPSTNFALYSEFYYYSDKLDVIFDPEFPISDIEFPPKIRIKNLTNTLHFQFANAGISPTKFQADSFPPGFRDKITVIHDGIDTRVLTPDRSISFYINEKIKIDNQSEIITFVNRNLEPYRGYHSFMRSISSVLNSRKNTRVLIIGGDDNGYGAAPPEGLTWKQIFINEVRGDFTDDAWSRVHFLGRVNYQIFISVLRLSTVHVYFTYPFVLSWSLLEAMSLSCCVLASDTEPVREVISNNKNGLLVDFFDYEQIGKKISYLLDNPKERERLSINARNHIIHNYDLHDVCIPRQIDWVKSLLKNPN